MSFQLSADPFQICGGVNNLNPTSYGYTVNSKQLSHTEADTKDKLNLIYFRNGKGHKGRAPATYRIDADVLTRWQAYCKSKKLYEVLEKINLDPASEHNPEGYAEAVKTNKLDRGEMAAAAFDLFMKTYPLDDAEIATYNLYLEIQEKTK